MGDRTLVYNQNNRLIRVEENFEILGEYVYNALGQRVIKEAGGLTTVFHYDFDGNIIGESDLGGTFTREYLYRGQNRLLMVDVASQAVYTYLNDRLGTPQVITDAEGNAVWEATYRPFGEPRVHPLATLENNFRFLGQYYDEETGLYYNYHRYYDPKAGRYLTPDPKGLEGGINLYSYVLNDPINLIDPTGLVTAVITVSDYGVGSHSAVYVDNNGSPAIYDPAGSYGDRATIGSGDLITGNSADLISYSNYHLDRGSRVSIHFFDTTPAEEAAIFNRAEEMGGGPPLSCALRVSDTIKGIGPFEELDRRYLPDTLYWALQRLQNE